MREWRVAGRTGGRIAVAMICAVGSVRPAVGHDQPHPNTLATDLQKMQRCIRYLEADPRATAKTTHMLDNTMTLVMRAEAFANVAGTREIAKCQAANVKSWLADATKLASVGTGTRDPRLLDALGEVSASFSTYQSQAAAVAMPPVVPPVLPEANSPATVLVPARNPEDDEETNGVGKPDESQDASLGSKNQKISPETVALPVDTGQGKQPPQVEQDVRFALLALMLGALGVLGATLVQEKKLRREQRDRQRKQEAQRTALGEAINALATASGSLNAEIDELELSQRQTMVARAKVASGVLAQLAETRRSLRAAALDTAGEEPVAPVVTRSSEGYGSIAPSVGYGTVSTAASGQVREPRAEAPARAGERGELTGDPVADYNLCLRLSFGEAEDLFYKRYPGLERISCTNIKEARNTNMKLIFRAESRGNFMLLRGGGRTVALPMIGIDPASSRNLLEGVFQYPPGPGEVRLTQAAVLDGSGADGMTLQTRGVFERD